MANDSRPGLAAKSRGIPSQSVQRAEFLTRGRTTTDERAVRYQNETPKLIHANAEISLRVGYRRAEDPTQPY